MTSLPRTSWLLPDVNVWVALNHDLHVHHSSANRWYRALPDDARIVFCRHTQLGLFRILSTAAVMGQQAFTEKVCWELFDRWVGTGQICWADESNQTHGLLRARTSSDAIAPKAWADHYLAAFAESAGLALVTFDKALAAKTRGAVLLA